jgi:hypothetical protein
MTERKKKSYILQDPDFKDCMICYMAVLNRSGEKYIGITNRELRIRKSEHESQAENPTDNHLLHRAIRKYGKEEFTWFVLAKGEKAIIETVENVLIKHMKTLAPYGFNSKDEYCDDLPTDDELAFFEKMDTNVQAMDVINDLNSILNNETINKGFIPDTKELLKQLIDQLENKINSNSPF